MISVTILTKNSAKYLREVLDALQRFDEILIYDNGSIDDTLAIAKEYPNVFAIEGPFIGFGPTHNIASNAARNDWILSIDSDEIALPGLVDEILSLKLDTGCVYSIPRENVFNGRVIYWCGWYPDRQYRLYNRKCTQFTEAKVHEQVIVKNMRIVELKNAIRHYSYQSIHDFLIKMQSYSDLFAHQNVGKKKASVATAVGHSVFTFFKSYFIKKGFLGGYEGFLISIYNAHTALYKYLKLRELNAKVINK